MARANRNAGSYPERKKAAMYAQTDIWQTRIARLLVVVLMCVHPLYFTSDRYLWLTSDKYVFFEICMLVVLLATIIVWISRIARKPKLLPQDRMYLADWAILGFALVTLLSTILSPYREVTDVWGGLYERHDGAVTQLLYVAVFFVVSRWYKPRELDFAFFGISAVLVALIGILQFYGVDFLKLWPNDDPQYHVENFYNIFFRSTLGNVDIVSAYVCVSMLLSGFLFIRMKSNWRPLWLGASALNFWLMELADADSGRVGLILVMVLAMPFIVENRKTLAKTLILASSWVAVYTMQLLFYDTLTLKTKTFGGLIPYFAAFAVLVAAGLFLLDWDLKHDQDSGPDVRAKWKLGIIIIAACVVVGIVGVEFLGKRYKDSGNYNVVYELREILHGNVKDEFGNKRVYIWRNALDGFKKNPIIGSGPDTFPNAFPQEAQGFYGENYENAHNEYIQILVCQGILGLVCYLTLIVGLLVKSTPQAFKNPLIMAIMAAFAGYCIQAFFNLSVPIVAPILWVFAGLLASKRVRETTQMAML
ncbi:MAG: O-antigen ligase family protein [Oscillospiraceae bacterium]|nr:O-antigen ligase family protein [Oscillospiraceae bacterium]